MLTSTMPAAARNAQAAIRNQNLGSFSRNAFLYSPQAHQNIRNRAMHPFRDFRAICRSII